MIIQKTDEVGKGKTIKKHIHTRKISKFNKEKPKSRREGEKLCLIFKALCIT